jgi:hypothetical protein
MKNRLSFRYDYFPLMLSKISSTLSSLDLKYFTLNLIEMTLFAEVRDGPKTKANDLLPTLYIRTLDAARL